MARSAPQVVERCRWCGGRMISSPGGRGLVCGPCGWASGECRCPIRADLVTRDTPWAFLEHHPCAHAWGGSDREGDGGHACGRPREHRGSHACSECGDVREGGEPDVAYGRAMTFTP